MYVPNTSFAGEIHPRNNFDDSAWRIPKHFNTAGGKHCDGYDAGWNWRHPAYWKYVQGVWDGVAGTGTNLFRFDVEALAARCRSEEPLCAAIVYHDPATALERQLEAVTVTSDASEEAVAGQRSTDFSELRTATTLGLPVVHLSKTPLFFAVEQFGARMYITYVKHITTSFRVTCKSHAI